MPAEYILLNRIQFGVNSLLARLHPTANWKQIMEEIATGGAPTTAMGEAEQQWLRDLGDLVERPAAVG